MRYLLMFSALLLVMLIGLRFLDEPQGTLPFEVGRVIILSGGRMGSPFSEAVMAGAERAERDLGCEINIVCTNWDPEIAAIRFQEEMAGVPDGICIVGDSENSALLPLIENALDEGIAVTSYQRAIPEALSRLSSQGYGFAGPDFFKAGQELIAAAVEKHKLSAGALVLLVNDPRQNEADGLFGGAMAAMESYGLAIESVDIDMGDPESTGKALGPRLRELDKNGKLPALLCSLNAPLESCITTLNFMEIEPETLPLVGVGVGTEMLSVLRSGKTNLSIMIDQDLPLQAYLAVLQACTNKKYAAVGLRLFTPYTIEGREKPEDATGEKDSHFVQRF